MFRHCNIANQALDKTHPAPSVQESVE